MNIQDYLNQKNPDYQKGIELLAKYNPRMAKIFDGRPQRYTRKLIYELTKIAKKQQLHTTTPVHPRTDRARPVSSARPDPSGSPSQKPQRDDTPTTPGVSRGTNDATPTTPQKPRKGDKPLPPSVDLVIKEHARLFQLRSQLAEQRAQIPEKNSQPNNKRRKALSQAIQELSEKIEILYNQKERYFEDNVIPGNDTENPFAHLTLNELNHRRKLTMKYINDLRTELDYNAKKKADRKNPMPPGEKRDHLEARLYKHQQNLKHLDNEIQKR